MKRRLLRYFFLGPSPSPSPSARADPGLVAPPGLGPAGPPRPRRSCQALSPDPEDPLMYTSLLPAIILLLAGVGAQAACRDDILATAPDSRYRDNSNGTVADLWTGLIWKQCAEGLSGADCLTGSPSLFTWQQALQHAEAQVFAGSSLWRLPNKNELASLVERRCYDPAINGRFFPNTPSDWFWSSSPDAESGCCAWYVEFYYGYRWGNNNLDQTYVRLVRGGQ